MKGVASIKKVFSGNRVIWLLAITAVVFLVLGIGLSRLIESPADAAARVAPPEEGLITVPVENRVIANDVVLRADVLYDESVEVKLEVAEIASAAIVTGQIPEIGATIDPGSVILEVAGRPVIALPGELPAYRTLRVGVSGPDVTQLKQALGALGISPGNLESDVYDAATATAVDALYVAAGYASPSASEEDTAALAAARADVTSAQTVLSDAETQLGLAQSGPSTSERLSADSAVNDAQRTLNLAIEARDAGPKPAAEGGLSAGELQAAVDSAQDALNIAVAQRDELLNGVTVGAETAARDSARTALADAQGRLDEALAATLTSLPSSEVVYFSNLPRRVDQVSINRGDTLTSNSAFMSVSGADVVISGSVAASDAELLENGQTGTFTLPDGSSASGTIASIEAAEDTSSEDAEGEPSAPKSARFTVMFTPEGLTDEQIASVLGQNLKITVPVNSTGKEVLAVPSAALTAGSGGESRIERMLDDDETELIVVKTGLAADGYVEIVSSESPLAEDDLVVVGK